VACKVDTIAATRGIEIRTNRAGESLRSALHAAKATSYRQISFEPILVWLLALKRSWLTLDQGLAGLSVSGAGIETGKLGVHMLAVESG